MAMLRLAVVFALMGVLYAASIPRKQLSGPPSEFASHALPDPSVGSVATSHATYVMSFGDNSALPWTQTIYVDSTTTFSFAMFSPISALSVSLVDPNGKAVDLTAHAQPVRRPWFTEPRGYL